MKTNVARDISIVAILIILLVCILNPYEFWMPTSVHMIIIVGLLILFAIYATFLFKEQSSDEREILLRMKAGRNAYFAGTVILITGIVVQSFHHHVDGWLVAAVIVMLLTKLGTRFYIDKHY